jgi:hypothetical protein
MFPRHYLLTNGQMARCCGLQLRELHCSRRKSDLWITNWKWSGKEHLWPNLRCYPGICLGVWGKLRKPTRQGSGLRPETLTRSLPNKKQECQPLGRDVLSCRHKHYIWRKPSEPKLFSAQARLKDISIKSLYFCKISTFGYKPCRMLSYQTFR